MPTTHSCGCTCACDPERTPEKVVHDAQKAVQEADQDLRDIRNSGASEEEIHNAEERRHGAQLALDAAYQLLISKTAHPKAELDDDEAIATDDEDDSDEEDSVDDVDFGAMNMEDDDDDDEDFVPSEAKH
ncbi:hypothetical protein PsYK624_019080 [Phanerochaete sordida]|uniref:Uncharacterized protein n=1 Tax=Phanerochaete sordida TaxID=48140 RepID=A0A9P3G0T1_9APHY|nr:hypothetical protein PsYK624_019080 [Phanerochaete sordida]